MNDNDDLMLLLNEKWNCSLPFGWVPITGDLTISNVEIFDSNSFQDVIGQIRGIISGTFEVDWLFEVREDGNFTKVNIADCGLCYDGLEYIYTDPSLEMVLYFSHENSTTIGGKALLAEIHQVWLEYAQHFWHQSSCE